MESYLNYKIEEFLIESYDGSSVIDVTKQVSFVQYYEDVFSPAIFITVGVANIESLLTTLTNKKSGMSPGIKGGERVSLKIYQSATRKYIKLDPTTTPYYIYKIHGSTSEPTREVFALELCPGQVFTNETTRCNQKYKGNISSSVIKILETVLNAKQGKQWLQKNIEATSNSYVFYGNLKRPFTVLTWLCPKSIPSTASGSSPKEGTAGYLFYQNNEGYNFRSMDTLMPGKEQQIETYRYEGKVRDPGLVENNFKVVTMPVFEKNVNVMENLRIGMYSTVNYFFDVNERVFKAYNYNLKESYKMMGNSSSKNTPPPLPMDLDSGNHPSRLMVRILDNFSSDPAELPPDQINISKDNTPLYQAASIARYNLAFSQKLNITVPLNLNLTVGKVIKLDFGVSSLNDETKGTKDEQKSGYYLIKELSHVFDKNQGFTGLKLIRDSYGAPSK